MRKFFFIIVIFQVLASIPCYAATRYFDGNLAANCAGGVGTSYRVAERDCNGSDGTVAYKDFSGHDGSGSFLAGDTYYVRAGTYDLSSGVIGDTVYISNDNVTLAGYPADAMPVLDGEDNSASNQLIFIEGCDGAVIDGLEIKDSSHNGIVVYGGDTNSATIKNSKIHGHSKAGISWWGGGTPTDSIDNCIIEYNEIYDNGFGHDGEAGISVQYVGSGNIIRYNEIYENGQPIDDLGDSWTEESTDLFYISYTQHSQPGGTTIKLYTKNTGTDCCPYGKKESTKGAVGVSSGHCDDPVADNLLGDYFIDTANSRIYVYWTPAGDPGQTYVCRSPSGYKYPDGNGVTLDTNSGGTTVHSNVIYGNGGSGINAANEHDATIYIYNNTLYNNGVQACSWADPIWYGAVVSGSNRANINMGWSTDNIIKNNIMSDGWQFNFITTSYNGSGTHTIDNNLYYNGGEAEIYWHGTNYTLAGLVAATTHEDKGVSSDPLFVNAGSDFHLRDGSPAKDAGTTISGIAAHDIERTARAQGSAWDIGAYEYPDEDEDSPADTYAPQPPIGLKIASQ